MSEPTLRILSLGAGVQSSTLALMAARGEVGPMPDCAIFADTGWEPVAVYRWLDWLETQLPFRVHRVTGGRASQGENGNIRTDALAAVTSGAFPSFPYFTESRNGGGQFKRQCTTHYKIEPIERKCRELLGVEKGKRVPAGKTVEQWFGISADEIYRVKESPTKWIKRRWPLVFEVRMTRQACIRWWKDRGLPSPPRSACIGCPYHSNAEWRDMKVNRPEEFADAVDFDEQIRGGVRGTRERCYLHSSLVPLSEVNLSSAEDEGQLSLFTSECEGMCGV